MTNFLLLCALFLGQYSAADTALVATQGALVSIELEASAEPAPQPEPAPRPDGQASAVGWPSGGGKDLLDRAKTAFVEEVKRVAESAKLDASVRVSFPDPPKAACCPGNAGCQATAEPPPITDYAAAVAAHQATGEPLAVLIGSKSCGPCRADKARLQQLKTPRAYLDATADADLVRQNLGEMPSFVPVLLVFRKNSPTERLEGAALTRWLEERSQ